MRVIHLLNHTRRLNGHVHAAVDLACAQTRLGHTVAVASGGGDFDLLLAKNEVETMPVDHERRPATLMKGLATLHRLARSWKADLMHAHMVTSAILAWPVCKSLGIPLITTVHNEFERAAILMGLGTRVITVSDAVGRSMRRRGISSSKLNVVLNGTIGSARFDGRDRTPRHLDGPSILFVGGLHPRKGLPDLLTAFDMIHDESPRARLYVVGEGPYLDTYVNLARSMSCGSAVTFLGAQEDPCPFLLGADIFVLPSHADPAPLVLSEAREAGCAIVAAEVDGIPELLENGKAGILVPTRNPARLAEALRSLVQSEEALQEWKQRSQFNLEHLRIERVARQTLDVYALARRQLQH